MMNKSRYTEEQIIGILTQHEAGIKTADLCREHGMGLPYKPSAMQVR